MRIKVDGISPVTKESKYFFFVVNYSQDGKPQKPRKIVSFGTGETAYAALKDAAVGDSFDVALEKDNNGYWQWKTVTKVEDGAPSTLSGTTGKSGNWETSEERARRQILIVRQSCLAQAVAATGPGQTLDEYIRIAGDFEEWVNRE